MFQYSLCTCRHIYSGYCSFLFLYSHIHVCTEVPPDYLYCVYFVCILHRFPGIPTPLKVQCLIHDSVESSRVLGVVRKFPDSPSNLFVHHQHQLHHLYLLSFETFLHFDGLIYIRINSLNPRWLWFNCLEVLWDSSIAGLCMPTPWSWTLNLEPAGLLEPTVFMLSQHMTVHPALACLICLVHVSRWAFMGNLYLLLFFFSCNKNLITNPSQNLTFHIMAHCPLDSSCPYTDFLFSRSVEIP